MTEKTIYPLPISNNFKLFNYKFKDGAFAECVILWPAKFWKDEEDISAAHVFILKNLQNHYFHVYWKWNKREPELLLMKHYDKCFDRKLHKSNINRYLFTAHGQSLLLPYVPHSLHQEWKKVGIEERDDSFVASIFQKYFDVGLFENKKKRFERFNGWQSRQLKNNLSDYVTFLSQHKETHVPINLNKRICDLNKDEVTILKNTAGLLHSIFPYFSTIEQ